MANLQAGEEKILVKWRTVRLSPKLFEWAVRRADILGINQSEYIRWLITQDRYQYEAREARREVGDAVNK